MKVERRDVLKLGAGAAVGGVVAAAAPAQAQSRYVIMPMPQAAVPIAGTDQLFPVRRIYCVGRNYLEHIREMGNDEREPPFFFQKPLDALVMDGKPIPYPSLTKNFHYEVELVVALKSGGRNITKEKARDHIYGYAVGLDMTRRDLQRASGDKKQPWEIGKSFDFSAPIAALHPVDKVGHPREGFIRLAVNGEVKQDSDLKAMIWNVDEIIANLSTQYELAAGDIIYTGTPHGVGPVKAGETMTCEIVGLGKLTTPVVAPLA
ncbi:MAG: fumarylacetoacetate hydrolase family protein [Alphaproteobacteria bacterium]|nr:fumarylacetoacetate hydrolase family protein [Alphaproteobacteria bacterium]